MAGWEGVHADRWLFGLTVGLAALTLALVVAYIVIVQDNRSVQAEANQRQQFINQSVQLGRINDALIRALAAAASNKKDDKLRDLLGQNGITINAAGEPTASGSRPTEQNTPPTPGAAR